MPMIKIKGIPEEEVIKESTELIDELAEIINCPRDYFTIELIENKFIMDGKIVNPPSIIEIAWFDRGQEVQDRTAVAVTKRFKKDRECLDVVFTALKHECYYENGEHF